MREAKNFYMTVTFIYGFRSLSYKFQVVLYFVEKGDIRFGFKDVIERGISKILPYVI